MIRYLSILDAPYRIPLETQGDPCIYRSHYFCPMTGVVG